MLVNPNPARAAAAPQVAKTVVRKITPTAKLVIDLPDGQKIEITSARTAALAVLMPTDYAWREEPKAAIRK